MRTNNESDRRACLRWPLERFLASTVLCIFVSLFVSVLSSIDRPLAAPKLQFAWPIIFLCNSVVLFFCLFLTLSFCLFLYVILLDSDYDILSSSACGESRYSNKRTCMKAIIFSLLCMDFRICIFYVALGRYSISSRCIACSFSVLQCPTFAC